MMGSITPSHSIIQQCMWRSQCIYCYLTVRGITSQFAMSMQTDYLNAWAAERCQVSLTLTQLHLMPTHCLLFEVVNLFDNKEKSTWTQMQLSSTGQAARSFMACCKI